MLTHDIVRPRHPARIGHQHWCLVLHGLGDSKEGWKPVAQMLGLDALGWIFANAPQSYGMGWSWFDLDASMRPDEAGIVRNRVRLGELIDHVIADLPVPAERLFIMGFSQGCVMALDAALRRSERFAGVIAISGWLAADREYPAAFGTGAKEQRVLWTHGTHDDLIPIHAPRRQAAALAKLGVAVDWREYAKDHGLDPERELGDIAAFITQRMRG